MTRFVEEVEHLVSIPRADKEEIIGAGDGGTEHVGAVDDMVQSCRGLHINVQIGCETRANLGFTNSVTIPALIIASVNAYNLWHEHWSHWEHLPPLEERTEYPYQNMRVKNFFWGNGDQVSPLLHVALISPLANHLVDRFVSCDSSKDV